MNDICSCKKCGELAARSDSKVVGKCQACGHSVFAGQVHECPTTQPPGVMETVRPQHRRRKFGDEDF